MACVMIVLGRALASCRTRGRAHARSDPQIAASAWRQFLVGLGASVPGSWANRRRQELGTLVARRGAVPQRCGAEAFAQCLVHGAVTGIASVVVLGLAAGLPGSCFGLCMAGTGYGIASHTLAAAAARRMRQLAASLPFALDLQALCLHAGGSLPEAMRAVARTDGGGALGAELRGVLQQVELGRTCSGALSEWAMRLRQSEVEQIVTSIVRAEELGTPLAQTLSDLADGTRQRRYAAAETAASEAPARMVGPTLLILLAAILLIAGPALLALMADGQP